MCEVYKIYTWPLFLTKLTQTHASHISACRTLRTNDDNITFTKTAHLNRNGFSTRNIFLPTPPKFDGQQQHFCFRKIACFEFIYLFLAYGLYPHMEWFWVSSASHWWTHRVKVRKPLKCQCESFLSRSSIPLRGVYEELWTRLFPTTSITTENRTSNHHHRKYFNLRR